MDKPLSLSVKDFLIRKMSVKLLHSEDILDKIVSHQFSSAKEAMGTNNSVEFSGLGKFLFNTKRAIKKFNMYYNIEKNYTNKLNGNNLSPSEVHKLQIKLKSVQDDMFSLKLKLNDAV